MFEQEIEMEKKEGSSFGPLLIIFLLIGLFVGGLGVVIFQSRQTPKPEQASAVIETRLKSAGPVSVTFHTGNISYAAADSPTDPQYKLLEKAGILKIGKAKNNSAQIDLTPKGKEFLTSFPDVKGVPGKNNTIGYTLPLASRKLVAVGKVTRLNQEKFQVQYTWSWQTTKAGEMFDVSGKLVQSLPTYERGTLIDQHGAKYFHAAPTQDSIVLVKADHGWESARAY
jgi:predicted transcriptional regulator